MSRRESLSLSVSGMSVGCEWTVVSVGGFTRVSLSFSVFFLVVFFCLVSFIFIFFIFLCLPLGPRATCFIRET